MITYRTKILRDWIDYNEHLRDAYYFLIFSHATDALMEGIGLDAAGRSATGHTLYTLEAHINYLAQARLGDDVYVITQIIDTDTKRLHITHSLHDENTKALLAVSEQMLMNIDGTTGRSAAFHLSVKAEVELIFEQQKPLPIPAQCGSTIAIRR